jgi:outer membrane receptor for ferrienterochelin and colicins
MVLRPIRTGVVVATVCVGLATSLGAQQTPPTPPHTKPADTQKPDVPPRFEELVEVTASRDERPVLDAPATVNVLESAQLATLPATGYADALRSIPGLNVIEASAGDLRLSSRHATSLGGRSQLVLIDGRPLYVDFIGIPIWQLAPVDLDDARQIEVVSGPVSATWGAEALSGVVNVITRSPRTDLGTRIRVRGGLFGRGAEGAIGSDAGMQGAVSVEHARHLSPTWAMRVNGGYENIDAYARPTGIVEVAVHPLDSAQTTGGAIYPTFVNRGLERRRAGVRFDQTLTNGGQLTYEGGYTSTAGLFHSPLGPFAMQNFNLGYGHVRYDGPGFRLRTFMHFLHGSSPNVLAVDPQGEPIQLDFNTQAFDMDGAKTWTVGGRHLVTAGGNYRRNIFREVSVAPAAQSRDQIGGYVQAALHFGQWEVNTAARLDKFETVAGAIFSPRAALLFKPTTTQTVRFSGGRSHRAPAAVDQHIDVTVIGGVFPLAAVDPSFGNAVFPLPLRTLGTPQVRPESQTTWELGYNARIGGSTYGLAVYTSRLRDPIAFVPSRPYSSSNVPNGWPLSPFVFDGLAQQGMVIPSQILTLNLGRVDLQGVELSWGRAWPDEGVSTFGNYSWQGTPSPGGSSDDGSAYPPGALTIGPRHRVNLGISYDRGRFLGGTTVSHVSGAFWTDVLTPSFWGPTRDYTLLGVTAGIRFAASHLTLTARATNLLNQDVQQHVFGDILKRALTIEAVIQF